MGDTDKKMKQLFENWRGYLHEQRAATIGDLIDAVEIIRKAQSKEAAAQKLKKVGGTISRFGLGLISVGVSEYIAQAIDTADAISSIFTTLSDPTTVNSGKLQNQPWIV